MQPSNQSSEAPSKSNIPSQVPSPNPTSDSPTQTLSPSFCVPSPFSCCNLCGSSTKKCFCDPVCVEFDDCCDDYASKCLSTEESCFTGINVCGNTPNTPFDAEVGSGSCSGDFACAGASGNIGETSCFDSQACYQFGYITFANLAIASTQEDTNGEGGKIPFARSLQELKKPIISPKDTDGEIQPRPIKVEGSSIGDSSCLGESACNSASGTIGSNSCIGFNACSYVPFKQGDEGIGEEFPSFLNPIQGEFAKQEGSILFPNEQVIEGKKYLSKPILPFTRSLLEEIQQPSIGDKSCSEPFACELNRGIIGDVSCKKGLNGKDFPSCAGNIGSIGSGSCKDHASCIDNIVRIGNGSW